MSEDNIINLADRRPVEAPKVVDEAAARHTAVSAEMWNSFSPEAKSDALTNDLVTASMIALKEVALTANDIEIEDHEIMEVYAAVAKITDRIFGVVKEVPDGEDS